MKIGQPLVLLLGGLLSASSVGCSAVSALVRDDRPAAGASQGAGSAERLVSIGRVFENQGRYDQAEVMYRRALKKKPNDPIIRQQIAALVERRNGRNPGEPMQSAIAAADSLTGRRTASSASSGKQTDAEFAAEAIAAAKASTGKSILQASETVSDTARVAVTHAANSSTKQAEKSQDAAKIAEERIIREANEFDSAVTAAKSAVADMTATLDKAETEVADEVNSTVDDFSEFEASEFEATLTESESKTTAASAAAPSTKITSEQIVAVIDTPDQNHALLLSGLTNGDSEETRCLAATLLGECAASNTEIGEALAKACTDSTDDRLTLACIDSQIQRGEADQSSAAQLITLLKSDSPDVQAQAAASLRCFTGSEAHKDCTAALVSGLANPNSDVRAIAALTLGDFPVLDQPTREALEKLAADDPDADVREAAKAAIARGSHPVETTHAMMIRPR
ncbi:MAG: HEAT repeat domain-containing protein [Planctomycetaceae bacterium]|nr:HEAT repeat domain-containing protein [Planctomycetaceae bacterium]